MNILNIIDVFNVKYIITFVHAWILAEKCVQDVCVNLIYHVIQKSLNN